MRELHPSVELYAHGVTLLVARDWDSPHRRFHITGPKYSCTIPACGCERVPCLGTGKFRGRCALSEKKGKDGTDHNREHCHGSGKAMHAEHVMVLAEEVLKTYNPKAKPSTPMVGVRRLSVGTQHFLPLEGWEAVNCFRSPIAGTRDWLVTCDSVRCRDERGRVPRLSNHGSFESAQEAVAQHKQWHAELRDEGAR